ncbi:hypothetical protein GCM10009069_17030 [Algimonas arctica]|uniref:Uncharacterized protein n=1 Tax=Algimonas arctica TaxID=1479486 RepID=A0A8J3G2D4_9PROT|nr:hypothetical protein [Algimonas arctica]GHA94656.1 hypothetical protein GCM10009069_17030 [Algimonas arctica]
MGFSKSAGCVAATWLVALIIPNASAAQSADLSPTLLIETGPSDNPNYRRMVFVKYLSADGVSVSYKAYNRSEFIQIDDATPDSLVLSCLNGKATTLADIQSYHRMETDARLAEQPPAIEHFCIKGVENWDAGNNDAYLDPIFEGMPHAATLNN